MYLYSSKFHVVRPVELERSHSGVKYWHSAPNNVLHYSKTIS